MATTNLGTVAVHGEDEWSPSKAYTKLSVVSYNGGSYMAKQAVPAGTALTDESYWMPISDTRETVRELIEQHPEWVTTVEDGSITEEKLAPELAEKIYSADEEIEDINDRLGDAETSISGHTDAITTLGNRIDQIILPPGSTPPERELSDIRVGEDGITYNLAGPAVRGQFRKIFKWRRCDGVSPLAKLSAVGGHLYASNGVIYVHGTPTATRYYCVFERQQVAKSSVKEFEETLPAGTYRFTIETGGYQAGNPLYLAYTYDTFADKVLIEQSCAITFDAPVMLAVAVINGRNYGTEDDPTYISVTIDALDVVDTDARSSISKLVSGATHISQNELQWEQGNITSTTGGVSDSTTRCRTIGYQLIGSDISSTITVPAGFRTVAYFYSDRSYTSYIPALTIPWFNGVLDLSEHAGKYVRFVIAADDDGTIIPADVPETYFAERMFVDPTLSVSGTAPDAKTVGDKLSVVTESVDNLASVSGDATPHSINGVTFTRISDTEFRLSGADDGNRRLHVFNWLLGNTQTPSYPTTELVANISEPGTYTLSYDVSRTGYTDPVFGLTEGSFSQRIGYVFSGETFTVTDGHPVALFACAPTYADFSGGALTVNWALYRGDKRLYPVLTGDTGHDAVARNIANAAYEQAQKANKSSPLSWGQANILANSRHVSDVVWTPVGNMPQVDRAHAERDPVSYFPMAEQRGLPYSSVRDQDKAIGMDVSIHTFLSAVRDPNSVLYTRRSTCSNSSTYYGTVCSGMINVAMGIGLNLTNYFLSKWDEFETIPMQAIQPGDMIWISGHCALIYDTKTDEYGRINQVTVAEEWRPLPRHVVYNSWQAFVTGRAGYIARRYKNRDGVPYTAIPYVQNFDEPEQDITWPNVQTDHGDAAVFMADEDVQINVIDAADYTDIVVTRGSTTVFTKSTIEGFTLQGVAAGLYTITAHSPTQDSVSTFYVVSATATFDASTGEVTFSSENAVPVRVNVYSVPVTEEEIHILTDAERAAGRANVLELISGDKHHAKVTFMTPYGTAVWYSETHEKWTPLPEVTA